MTLYSGPGDPSPTSYTSATNRMNGLLLRRFLIIWTFDFWHGSIHGLKGAAHARRANVLTNRQDIDGFRGT